MTFFTKSLIIFIIFSFSALSIIAQNQYKVGGDQAWRIPDDQNSDFYSNWASKIRFQVGDSIIFEYKNDSVIRVDKTGYYHCNESENGAILKDGSTVFLFDKPGLFYFVSGEFEHCKKGERLMVDVMASHGSEIAGAPGPSPHYSFATPAVLFGGFVMVLAVGFCTMMMI